MFYLLVLSLLHLCDNTKSVKRRLRSNKEVISLYQNEILDLHYSSIKGGQS